MTGIKNALNFLWGIITGNGWSFASYIIVGLTTFLIFMISIWWLIDHWNDK